jgi:pantoate--beta-alanine ligase
MKIARTQAELDRALAPLRAQGIGFAPTMGALHQGHLALLEAAKRDEMALVASIFVNPLQFGPNEDYARYPRDEKGDLAALERAGCQVVWLPDTATMYPPGLATRVEVEGPALGFEGSLRPGHFRGVATVVARLFGQIRPARAYFGEKDWQQVQVVRRMVTDLALPVSIVPVPTYREADGLAMSSRNRYLTSAQRALAPMLPRVMQATAAFLKSHSLLQDSATAIAATLKAAQEELREAGFAPDYLALVDGPTLEPILRVAPGARLIAAARLGPVRLIDTLSCED